MHASTQTKTICFPNTPLLPDLCESDRYDIALTLCVHMTDNGPAFSVHTELVPTGGHTVMISTEKSNIAVQMLRNAYPADSFVETLTRLISLYDKNHMHAGTQRQETAVKQAVQEGLLTSLTYTTITNYLKTIHLYTDDSVRDADGEPHRYGHGWIYTSIPEEDMQTICDIISGNIVQTTVKQEHQMSCPM